MNQPQSWEARAEEYSLYGFTDMPSVHQRGTVVLTHGEGPSRLLNKRDSEISKWLTGRHNFTTQTIARIETTLGSKLICIAH